MWLSVHVTTGEDTMCCSKQNVRKCWYTGQLWSSRWLDVEQRDFLKPQRWFHKHTHKTHPVWGMQARQHSIICEQMAVHIFRFYVLNILYKRKLEIGLNNIGHLFYTSEYLLWNCFDIMKTFQEGKHFTRVRNGSQYNIKGSISKYNIQSSTHTCELWYFWLPQKPVSMHCILKYFWVFLNIHLLKYCILQYSRNLSECKIQFHWWAKQIFSHFELSGDRKWMYQSINPFICPHWSSGSKTQSWME